MKLVKILAWTAITYVGTYTTLAFCIPIPDSDKQKMQQEAFVTNWDEITTKTKAKMPIAISGSWLGDSHSLCDGGWLKRPTDPTYPRWEGEIPPGKEVFPSWGECSDTWRKVRKFLSKEKGPKDVAQMSALEKYALLIGSKPEGVRKRYLKWLIQKNHWATDLNFAGYCHLTTAAGSVGTRPQRAVTVIAADGKTFVPFSRTDIESLIAMSRINSEEDVFLGDRHQVINAASFFLATINYLALQKRAFVYNVVNDIDLTKNRTRVYNRIIAELSDLKIAPLPSPDVQSIFRSEKTSSVVAVEMTIQYLKPFESPGAQENPKVTRTYSFSLGLDEALNVIDGEWDAKEEIKDLPSFVWRAGNAVGPGRKDSLPETWDLKRPLPKSWAGEARELLRESFFPAVAYTRTPEVAVWLVDRLRDFSQSHAACPLPPFDGIE